MVKSILVLILFISSTAFAVCTAYCKPGISRACGQGCVSIYKNCSKATTTACNGEKPKSVEKNYSNPKKVEPEIVENNKSEKSSQ